MQTAILPMHWQPKPAELVRLGAMHDGGYVVPLAAVEAASCLLSFGVERDWSFEQDFARLKPAGFRIDCFDPTTPCKTPKPSFERRVWHCLAGYRHWRHLRMGTEREFRRFFGKPNVRLHTDWIGASPDSESRALTFTDVLDAIQPQAPIFLKVDIEGAEWSILDELAMCADLICGIAIEFHDLKEHHGILSPGHALFRAFDVSNIHVNNHAPDFRQMPDVVEFSLISKALPAKAPASPGKELNRPNRHHGEEIRMEFVKA